MLNDKSTNLMKTKWEIEPLGRETASCENPYRCKPFLLLAEDSRQISEAFASLN